eukprot:7175855-Pyramimonas_sp.AAC.2
MRITSALMGADGCVASSARLCNTPTVTSTPVTSTLTVVASALRGRIEHMEGMLKQMTPI